MLDYVKALYNAHGTLYRLIWTTAQLACGAIVVAFGADPKIGLLVTLLATAVTSIARENLARRR